MCHSGVDSRRVRACRLRYEQAEHVWIDGRRQIRLHNMYSSRVAKSQYTNGSRMSDAYEWRGVGKVLSVDGHAVNSNWQKWKQRLRPLGKNEELHLYTLSSRRRICIIRVRNDSSINVDLTVSTSNWHRFDIDQQIISHWRILRTLGGNKELTLYPDFLFSYTTCRSVSSANSVDRKWIGLVSSLANKSVESDRCEPDLGNSARLNYTRFFLIVRSVKRSRALRSRSTIFGYFPSEKWWLKRYWI